MSPRFLRTLNPIGLFTLDALVYFLAMHRDIPWGINADAHLIPLYTKNRNGDLVTDHQGLADPSS
jgi:hypothetical protein